MISFGCFLPSHSAWLRCCWIFFFIKASQWARCDLEISQVQYSQWAPSSSCSLPPPFLPPPPPPSPQGLRCLNRPDMVFSSSSSFLFSHRSSSHKELAHISQADAFCSGQLSLAVTLDSVPFPAVTHLSYVHLTLFFRKARFLLICCRYHLYAVESLSLGLPLPGVLKKIAFMKML